MSEDDRHHHIHRHDSETKNRHRWRVQIQCNGQLEKRDFSDAKYGSKDKALKAALAWRDAMFIVMKPELTQRRISKITNMREDNTSGIVGVGRYVMSKKVNDKIQIYTCWQASWTDPEGKKRIRHFSVLKYGEKRAKELACAARKAGSTELIEHHQHWL